MKRQIADRITIGVLGLLDIGTAVFEPTTLRHVVFVMSGTPGKVLLAALAIAAILVILDTIINDVMPEKFQFKLALAWRQRLWLAIAMIFMMQAFVMAKTGVGYWIAGFYVVLSIRSALVAFLDLHYETSAARKSRRSTDHLGVVNA